MIHGVDRPAEGSYPEAVFVGVEAVAAKVGIKVLSELVAVGLMNKSGFQYQIINIAEVPKSSFTNTRPILESRLNFRY